MEGSKIQWCHNTFNPWMGCTKVSDGCKFCYAERDMDHRFGKVKWGPQGKRVKTSLSYWGQPLLWNERAKHGVCVECGTPPGNDGDCKCGQVGATGNLCRLRVFCASLADVFEDRDGLASWREELIGLILNTPNIDWLLLTKRIENADSMVTDILRPVRLGWEDLPNVWIGTSVENQETADERIPHLLSVPARVRFLSAEPLLGPIDLTRSIPAKSISPLLGANSSGTRSFTDYPGKRIDWVIAGGESGHNARPMHPDWVRSLRDQCQEAGVPFFFKQWGEWGWSGHWLDIPLRFSDTPGKPFDRFAFSDKNVMIKVGKKAAGRLLDSREWNEYPEAAV